MKLLQRYRSRKKDVHVLPFSSRQFVCLHRLRGCALQPITSRWQDSNLWPSVPKTDALTRLRYTSSHHPGAYRSTRSMNTQTELAHPFGHMDARTNPKPLFLRTSSNAKKPYSAGALTFFGLLFHFHFQIRLAPGYVSFGPFARLEVDSNHWHKDFQSFALTSWAT